MFVVITSIVSLGAPNHCTLFRIVFLRTKLFAPIDISQGSYIYLYHHLILQVY